MCYSPLSSQKKKKKWLPVSNKVTLKQVKLVFGPLVIQLVWYILKQLFTSVAVEVVDIYLVASGLCKYPPLFTSTLVQLRKHEATRSIYTPPWMRCWPLQAYY